MPASPYRRIERWLHWLALQPAAVRELSFELECQFALRRSPHPTSGAGVTAGESGPADRAVYVCGLARSGTTMLLELLEPMACFRSLTYRDMPFVLAPNAWRHIHRHFGGHRRHVGAERAHGDGVMVGYDSPEAFEEVFWRTFGQSAMRLNGAYGSAQVDDEALARFADYRSLVANPKSDAQARGEPAPFKRYLSKNNNNLLRLPRLMADPSATALLVYRDPVATARSLHRLHLRFGVQAHDAFSQRYMAWLGHHEFGPGHLPFSFAVSAMDPALSPQEPDYWLDYWDAVHRHLLEQAALRVDLVNHDELRRSPLEAITALLHRLGEVGELGAMSRQVRPADAAPGDATPFSAARLERARDTHRRLVTDPRNLFKHTPSP